MMDMYGKRINDLQFRVLQVERKLGMSITEIDIELPDGWLQAGEFYYKYNNRFHIEGKDGN